MEVEYEFEDIPKDRLNYPVRAQKIEDIVNNRKKEDLKKHIMFSIEHYINEILEGD